MEIRAVADARRTLRALSTTCVAVLALACTPRPPLWEVQHPLPSVGDYVEPACGVAISRTHAAVCAPLASGARAVDVSEWRDGRWAHLQRITPRPVETTETHFGTHLTFGKTLETVELSGGLRTVRTTAHLLVSSHASFWREGARAGAVEHHTIVGFGSRSIGLPFAYSGTMTPLAEERVGVGLSFESTQFGSALDMSGRIIVIGAYNGARDRGVAYIFDAITNAQLAELKPDEETGRDRAFGHVVATSGDRVVVGYPRFCNERPTLPCASPVYVYAQDGSGTWRAEKLVNPLAARGGDGYNDTFGTAVASSEGLLAVGDAGEFSPSASSQPRVHFFIYARESGRWAHARVIDVASVTPSRGPVADGKMIALAYEAESETWVDVYNNTWREAHIRMPSSSYAMHIDLQEDHLIISTGDRTNNAVVYRRQ